MIRLRSFTEADILPLNELWEQHWSHESLPNRRNAIIDAIAENENSRIIGYGQVKLFAENMLFLDPTARTRDRAKALKLLMQEAFMGTHFANIEEMYAFIKDPEFAQLIANRYGFKRIVSPGELLLRRLT